MLAQHSTDRTELARESKQRERTKQHEFRLLTSWHHHAVILATFDLFIAGKHVLPPDEGMNTDRTAFSLLEYLDRTQREQSIYSGYFFYGWWR